MRSGACWAVWLIVAAMLWAGVVAMYLNYAGAEEIPERYAPELVASYNPDPDLALLSQPPIPASYRPGGKREHHLPRLRYPHLLETYWHALMDAGLPPLMAAPTKDGRTWLSTLDLLIYNEGSWPGELSGKKVPRPDCVGLNCAYIRNPGGSLDRGAAAYNDYWSADVPDAVAFNLVLSVRQVAKDWASCYVWGRCVRSLSAWYGLKAVLR